MLFLLMLPVVAFVATVDRVLQLYAPSNLVIARTRMMPPRWRNAVLLAALAVATFMLMHLLAEAVTAGGPGWLNLVVLILAWDAIKLGMAGVGQGVRTALRPVGGSWAKRRG